MKTLKKIGLVIIIATIITLMLYGLFSRTYVYAGNAYRSDTRTQWGLRFSNKLSDGRLENISLHINNSCFNYNNIYCIQKGYEYNDDSFIIRYGIEIDGNTASLYEGSWSNKIATWDSSNNNILAGILTPTETLKKLGVSDTRPGGNFDTYTVGLQLNGDMTSGSPSTAQQAVHYFWENFEDDMEKALKADRY